MMIHEERVTLITKSNLKRQSKSQVYVIKVMCTYLLKELYQSQIWHSETNQQIIGTLQPDCKRAK